MSNLSRRQLLIFFGASAATTALAPTLSSRVFDRSEAAIARSTFISPKLTPVRLPHPLPAYQAANSYLPETKAVLRPTSNVKLDSYTVVDDVVVPPEYSRYVVIAWGDRVFPSSSDYFGYNNDYTAFIPVRRRDFSDGYLWVNHEYISYPFSPLAPGADPAFNSPEFKSTFEGVVGFALPDVVNTELLGEFAYNVGGAVVRIRRNGGGEYKPVARDSANRRYSLVSGLALNRNRSFPAAWGARPHQRGDNNYFIGTGPAATDVFKQVNSDSLGEKIIGTGFNCSGGDTPWGTILSAEENFQASSTFFVGVQELVDSKGTQTEYIDGTVGAEFGLVGEKYGWMVEVDPENPNVRAKKHTALGRFRHENIAFRLRQGQPLIAYMGDDRRGGHTWKYVSKGVLGRPRDKSNSRLFEEGTLYVAKFNPNGTGEWLPLEINQTTNPIPPSVLASEVIAALGDPGRSVNLLLPLRPGFPDGGFADAGGNPTDAENGTPTLSGKDGGVVTVTLENESILSAYQGKKLSDFYASQGAVLVDSYLAANLIGGTPSARPEDLEVHPRTGEVFIAYTDHIPGGDGYPDSRIFQTAKLSPEVDAQQPSGGLYKIIESSANGAGTTFRWDNFAPAGEAGADEGTGFANVDNLAFDGVGNVWGVTDMSTSRQNGFRTGINPGTRTIDHTETGSTDALVGVFGNNWVFYIPTRGQDAGTVVPFAQGPMRCEITGPTFVGSDTLIASVQHPGEDVPVGSETVLEREIEMLNLDGTLFNQVRRVPLSSGFPSNIGYPLPGDNDRFEEIADLPRPCIIGIQRLDAEDGDFAGDEDDEAPDNDFEGDED